MNPKASRSGLCLGAILLASISLIWLSIDSVGPAPTTLAQSDGLPSNGWYKRDASLVAHSREQVRKLLNDLSILARALDSGALNLSNHRPKTCQPDSIMWELRVLVHSCPEAIQCVKDYLDSTEPIGGKLIALFAFAQPQSQELINFLASIIRGPVDVRLSNAACLCFDVVAAHGIYHAWQRLFQFYDGLGLSSAYCIGADEHYYLPPNWRDHETLFHSHMTGFDLNVIVDAMRSLLDNSDPRVFRNVVARLIREGSQRKEVRHRDHSAIQGSLERIYLEGGGGWESALEGLTDPGQGLTQRQVEILASGMSRFDSDRKLTVMQRVASVAPSVLFREPFSSHLSDAILRLGKAPTDEGVPLTAFGEVTWALLTASPDEEWIRRQLIIGGSNTHRQRAAVTMASWGVTASISNVTGHRLLSLCDILMADSLFEVRLLAATATLGLMENLKPQLSQTDIQGLRARIKSWSLSELALKHTAQEEGSIRAIWDRVK